MLKTLNPVLLAALLAMAPAAFAQETDAEDTATTEEAAPSEDAAPAEDAAPTAGADPADATDLSLGEPVQQVGQPYIREEFGDWALRCLRAPEGQNDPCQLYQLLLDENDNAVAEISMFPLADGGRAAAGATIVVPLETLLNEQLTLTVDGGQARRYPYTFCNAAGCVARVGFTTEEVNLFKRGNAATLRMVPAGAPDQEVVLSISLNGFTAGYNASE